MADDERRAEIEAREPFGDPWGGPDSHGNEPTIRSPQSEDRDDDEAARAAAQHREDTSKLVAAGVRITELENEVERLRARLHRWEAGFAATEELQLVRNAQGDDEGLCPECQLPKRDGEHQMGCSRSPQGEK